MISFFVTEHPASMNSEEVYLLLVFNVPSVNLWPLLKVSNRGNR
uniref:Uncharacterized protein n=1 Tax=Anguilla anguilla TaxID=7936 RepID=A0A0E9TV09_ANGAN